VVFRHILEQEFIITIGKLGDKEIDFVSEKPGKRIYIQCAYLIPDNKTREREFGNLLKIKDNHRKMVVSLDEPSGGNIEGVEHIHLREFLSMRF
ncbi:MAG: ATPase, partial [Bacteroidales bacterium]|nr:ATPase [Bacteroidales bacterium]